MRNKNTLQPKEQLDFLEQVDRSVRIDTFFSWLVSLVPFANRGLAEDLMNDMDRNGYTPEQVLRERLLNDAQQTK